MAGQRILTLDEVRARGNARGAIITNDHVVLTEKPDGFWHAPGYFDKDRALSDPACLNSMAYDIAKRFCRSGIQAVVGPTYGAVGLAAAVAISLYRDFDTSVESWGWAQQATDEIEACPIVGGINQKKQLFSVPRGRDMVVTRCFPEFFCDRTTLVVEDVSTSGGSARKTIEAAEAVGARVAGLAVVCDRSGLTAEDLGVSMLEVLFSIPMVKYREDECPLCAKGVPINMQVGHGAKFFQRHPDSTVPKKAAA